MFGSTSPGANASLLRLLHLTDLLDEVDLIPAGHT
jgi:hypothetical protein